MVEQYSKYCNDCSGTVGSVNGDNGCSGWVVTVLVDKQEGETNKPERDVSTWFGAWHTQRKDG